MIACTYSYFEQFGFLSRLRVTVTTCWVHGDYKCSYIYIEDIHKPTNITRGHHIDMGKQVVDFIAKLIYWWRRVRCDGYGKNDPYPPLQPATEAGIAQAEFYLFVCRFEAGLHETYEFLSG